MTTALVPSMSTARKRTPQQRSAEQPQVGLNKIQEQLFRTLNAEFGSQGWTVNTDRRYCTQIGCYPIDIIVPIKDQAEILPRVLKLQADLSKKHDIQVFFVITAPD